MGYCKDSATFSGERQTSAIKSNNHRPARGSSGRGSRANSQRRTANVPSHNMFNFIEHSHSGAMVVRTAQRAQYSRSFFDFVDLLALHRLRQLWAVRASESHRSRHAISVFRRGCGWDSFDRGVGQSVVGFHPRPVRFNAQGAGRNCTLIRETGLRFAT